MKSIEESVAALNLLLSDGSVDLFERLSHVSKGEIFVLRYLHLQGVQVIPSAISGAMHTSTARVSAILRTLEKKGQIVRQIDVSNRRNILVDITEEGRQRLDAYAAQMRSYLMQVLSEVGEQDAREFVRLLTRLFEVAKRIQSCPLEEGRAPDG